MSSPSGIAPINLREVAPSGVVAAIFDMDDLMIDSHPLHMKVFAAVLADHGVNINDPTNPWTPHDEASMFGLKISDAFKLFIARYKIPPTITAEQLQYEFDEQMLPVFKREPIEPMPGLMDLLDALAGHGLERALASSARRSKIDIVLGKLGLEQAFAAIVSGEDEIQRGKPAPDIFLAAAGKVGKQPAQCVAFEDARNGIEAINATNGMFSVGVHNQFSEQRLGIRQDLSEANLQVDSLTQLTYIK